MFSPFPRGTVVRRIHNADEVIAAGIANRRIAGEPLYWSRTHFGVGVLQALRSHRRISFGDMQPPGTNIDMESSHIVVCEDGDAHSQVIAAAYALSIDAGLCVIPECPRDEADDLLESLYGLSEQPAPAARLEELRGVLQAHIGGLDLRRKTVTFVTAKLPWGLAFPDVPSTHLFRYPDLGIAIVNGIAAEQDDSPGIRSAVVIAPHSAASVDAQTALTRLTDVGVLSKALRGRVATVHQASKTITLFPYDLLLIATHSPSGNVVLATAATSRSRLASTASMVSVAVSRCCAPSPTSQRRSASASSYCRPTTSTSRKRPKRLRSPGQPSPGCRQLAVSGRLDDDTDLKRGVGNERRNRTLAGSGVVVDDAAAGC